MRWFARRFLGVMFLGFVGGAERFARMIFVIVVIVMIFTREVRVDVVLRVDGGGSGCD